jgi:hypothetical protein
MAIVVIYILGNLGTIETRITTNMLFLLFAFTVLSEIAECDYDLSIADIPLPLAPSKPAPKVVEDERETIRHKCGTLAWGTGLVLYSAFHIGSCGPHATSGLSAFGPMHSFNRPWCFGRAFAQQPKHQTSGSVTKLCRLVVSLLFVSSVVERRSWAWTCMSMSMDDRMHCISCVYVAAIPATVLHSTVRFR